MSWWQNIWKWVLFCFIEGELVWETAWEVASFLSTLCCRLLLLLLHNKLQKNTLYDYITVLPHVVLWYHFIFWTPYCNDDWTRLGVNLILQRAWGSRQCQCEKCLPSLNCRLCHCSAIANASLDGDDDVGEIDATWQWCSQGRRCGWLVLKTAANADDNVNVASDGENDGKVCRDLGQA